MLVMTKQNQICPILMIIKLLDQKFNFLSVSRTLVIDVCDVRVCYRLMVVVVKAMHTAYTLILVENLLSDV